MTIASSDSFLTSGRLVQYPIDEPLINLFLNQVASKPDFKAILELDQEGKFKKEVSYLELNDYVSSIAAHLDKQGIKPGDRIALYMERSIDHVACLLALMKLRACYIPLETRFPEKHVEYIIKETVPKCILIGASCELSFLMHYPCISLSAVLPLPWEEKSLQVNHEFLIMFSSGTTGQPKGVIHSERQLINRFYWLWNLYPFQTDDVIAVRGSIGVMPSMWEILGGILFGIKSVIIPNAILLDPIMLLQSLKSYKISYITLPTVLLRVLLSDYSSLLQQLACLKLVITGGELMSLSLLNKFKESCSQAVLIDDYGATEVNTFLYRVFEPSNDYEILPNFIPIDNLSVSILDENGKLLSAGQRGEICVSGVALAQAYLNQPELTANKMIDHPLVPGEKFYRTGDIGCFSKNGVQLFGRSDQVIKINGMNVDLTYVESVILQQEFVKECVVLSRELKSEVNQILAFLEIKDSIIFDSQEFYNNLNNQLPDYMSPSIVKIVPNFKRTPNGKIDKKLLIDSLKDNFSNINSSNNETQQMVKNVLFDLLEIKDLPLEADFFSMGMNSLLVMKFATQLSKNFNCEIKIPEIFNHSSIMKLTDYIDGLQQAEVPRLLVDEVVHTQDHEQIAIVGMSGRFPGAETVDAFWSIINAAIVVETSSEARTVWNKAEEKPIYVKLVSDIEGFDYEFFNISLAEAKVMDPQHRLCLQEVWRLIESSGYDPKAISGSKTGVYIGAKQGDYKQLIKVLHKRNAYSLLGNDLSYLASRISYYFNLKGPSLVFDTACSSSLVALHHAMQAIRQGDIDQAIVGGVFLQSTLDFYHETSDLGVYSSSGVCRPFDSQADGFVQGEAVCFIILKPLNKALMDRDKVYALVKATGIAQEGRTNGLASPSSDEQAKLIVHTYKRYGINPEDVTYYEAHGTGTALGDPIEFDGMCKAYRYFTDKSAYCMVGSVKANIGHATTAAGLVGLIKVVMALQNKLKPGMAHFNQSNQNFVLEKSPFYFSKDAEPWPIQGAIGLAAVSSFGMGGVNAHAVIQSYPLQNRVTFECSFYPIMLSAKSKTSLLKLMRSLRNYLVNPSNRPSLIDVSYTLLSGRSWFKYRFVAIIKNYEELIEQLNLAIEAQMVHICSDHSKLDVDIMSADQVFTLLREASHMPSDFINRFFTDGYQRINLPAYEFNAMPCWITQNDEISVQKTSTEDNKMTLAVVEILRSLLEVKEVNLYQTLESLGYDSIAALALQVEIEKRFNVIVNLEELVPIVTPQDIINSIVARFQPESVLNSEFKFDDLSDQEINALYANLMIQEEIDECR